jgi:site-specific DNA-methyltransferase (adenine-specific)
MRHPIGPGLYHGDAMDLMDAIPPGTVDLVLTDPPYSSGGAYRGDRVQPTQSKYHGGDVSSRPPEFAGDGRDQLSYLAWTELWARKALRATRPGGIAAVFTDWRQVAATITGLQAAGWIYRGLAVWDKTPAVRPQRGRYAAQCEYLVWGSRGPRPTEGPCLAGCWSIALPRAERHHTASKPLALLRELLAIAPAGGTVLDPFMGSGSVGVACAELGLAYIGMEVEACYHRTAVERIAAATEPGETAA